MDRPNVIFVFSDQHRWHACGCHGDPNVRTPNMDWLSRQSVEFTMAVSGMPVCCPYRASLLTGQYPHHHGIFLNDLSLDASVSTIGEIFKAVGYDTAYIGKWHLNGRGRSVPIPREGRYGFDYWKVLECTHDYNHSYYYSSETEKDGEGNKKQLWKGYDAAAQTDDAIGYINDHKESKMPFFLVLSWGPPHDPYDTAPETFKMMYKPEKVILRENVPEDQAGPARRELSGYYAHISALDHCLGRLMEAVKADGLWENTIFVYTSDHGDMLHSQGVEKKQKPWEESIRVPFWLSYPKRFGHNPIKVNWPLNSPDIMPTLLELCHIDIPTSVDGQSLLEYIHPAAMLKADDFYPAVLIQCISPNGEWHKFRGGRPYRGIRTLRYTYVKDLNGPWLLYDNYKDPFQLCNILERGVTDPSVVRKLDQVLTFLMTQTGDEFLSNHTYLEKWGYPVDFLGTHQYKI